MRLPEKGGADFAPAPAGTHIAVCIKVVDLGSQQVEWPKGSGNTKSQHKVTLAWELSNELMDDGRPFILTQRYTFSVSEKATFRKHLESWRGKPFEDADFGGPKAFDVKNVLGKGCTLFVAHKVTGDKTYSNVTGIGPLPKGVTAPPPQNGLTYFSLERDRFDANVLASLSPNMQALIMASPEYQQVAYGNPAGAAQDPSDEIPF
jgi:hypothetical protein